MVIPYPKRLPMALPSIPPMGPPIAVPAIPIKPLIKPELAA